MTRQIGIPGALLTGAAFVVMASLLAACGSEHESTAPAPVEETAGRDMARAMEKARAVEGTMQEHKEALDRTLQQNENPTAE